MALNPIAYTEKVVGNFLKYQLTTYPLADPHLYQQMRTLLSLDETRRSPLLKGPYISLSRSFRQGAQIQDLIAEGVLHPAMAGLIPFPQVYGHQERAIRAVHAGRTTLVSTGTGSGKTECFLYPIISRCFSLRDSGAPSGIAAVLVYPMNALAEDQLARLRELLAGTGITFGMYVGKTPEERSGVAGERLRAGASREDYRRKLAKAQAERRGTAVHPFEERCSREEMRTEGQQPRILLTNVKQLELLLTRHADETLFDGARLDYLVFDEAHTFSGAGGAETACLIRRLRAFVGKDAGQATCVATSATIADPERGPDAACEFAARFFGVEAGKVELVGEEYEPDVWSPTRTVRPPLLGDPAQHLATVLRAVDGEPETGRLVCEAIQEMTGTALDPARWEETLYDFMAANELVYQLAESLAHPRPLPDLLQDVEGRVGRPVPAEEALAWLTLGVAARQAGRPLLRPVVHAFVRGVAGAVVTFPGADGRPRLWLSAEDEEESREQGTMVRLPLRTCTTCGQHYFTHSVADFTFTDRAPGGGEAVGDSHVWRALDPNLGGHRVVLVDRVISADEDDDDPARTAPVFLCRSCGALHPTEQVRCLACGVSGPLVRLLVVAQKPDMPGLLTRCISCGAPGRQRGTGYREPARPVRAVNVSDVHVLAQDMVNLAERRRLLVFTDNRQDAAFQAGWMRDHARRFRLRTLMAEILKPGPISFGDLTARLDDVLNLDDDLSRALAQEVWAQYRKEGEGLRHAQERKRFLRIQVLRELTMGVKQRIGLEPWGRLRVIYAGLDARTPFVAHQSAALGIPPERLAEGIAALLDRMRRSLHLWDREEQLFTKFWDDGALEIQRGYFPKMPGVPKGLKLRREEEDDQARITGWLSRRGDTPMRQTARKWEVPQEQVEAFVEALWDGLTGDLRLLAPVTLRGYRGRPLPRCAGTYQIDGDKLLLGPGRGMWRCRTCRRMQTRPVPFDRCLAWRCDGVLEFVEEDPDNYDLTLLDGQVQMVRPREHSAQVPAQEREILERAFKGEGELVNTLVCTPTLELGVDIGALDTVLMRNVPPLPSNYWQRAGRAGRRHRMAVNLTYARASSHDRIYFAQPLRMLEGRIEPPSFNLRNELMVRKHVHAAMLSRLHQLARSTGGLSQADREEIAATLERIFPAHTKSYLFDESGHVRATLFDVTPFRELVSKHEDRLFEHVRAVFTQGWPASDAEVVQEDALRAYLQQTPDTLQDVMRTLKKRLDWALGEIERLNAERRKRGTLDPDEDALFQRCDRLVKRFRGQLTRQRRETEGIDDISTFSMLSAEGFLPGYGLEIGSVLGTAQMPRFLAGTDLDLRRPSAVAVREYVPGNLIYANGHRFVPRYYHFLAETTQPTLFQVDTVYGAVSEIGTGGGNAVTGLGAASLRAVPICDVDMAHRSHITDEEENRFQLPVAVYGYELDQHGGGRVYRWGARDLLQRRGVRFRLVNVGPTYLIGNVGRLGYPICLVCGQSRSPFSSQRERDEFASDHRERCGQTVEPTGFFADVVADAISLPSCTNQEEAYSVLEALRVGATQVLDMEREDLAALVIGCPGREEALGILFDPMPGGSGLLDQICARFSEVVETALEAVEQCPSACARGCVDCLFTFRNAFYHKHLNRLLAIEKLKAWGPTLLLSHEIPQRLPAVVPTGVHRPVNECEARLRELLLRAGFPEAKWQQQIILGRPLGSTTPDAFFAEEDEHDPGVCLYLDGLSEHIHGNPATAARDRAIREELRAKHYEVFEIAATDLWDQEKMRQYFFRLGRILLGRDRAKELRDTPEWFSGAESPGAAEPAKVLPFRKVGGDLAGRYRTCVPLVTLKAAAGGFGNPDAAESEQWVEPNTNRHLKEGMFVAQVVGHSMEPLIPDGAYCLFASPVIGSRTGRILLVQHRDIADPETGGSYTVKKFDSSGVQGKEGTERVGTICLRPLNPAYMVIELKHVSEDEVTVVAELVEALREN